ncbi:MAG: hypothetical protein PGN13_07180 [Patulibacter minatonensis]
MNVICGAAGEATHVEMSAAEFASRSASYKDLVDDVPHYTVWCVVGQRVSVPVVLVPAAEPVPAPL